MGNKTKKIIALLLFFSVLSLSLPAPARASWWGEPTLAVKMQITIEKMLDQIENTMIANLKMMAIRLVQTRLMSIFSGAGGSGGPKVIGEFRQFIYGTAMTYSMQATNDFFRSMQSGLPSPMVRRIILPAQRSVMANPYAMQPDLQNYVREGRADMIFRQGWAPNQWAAWRQSFMPQNDMGMIALRAQAVKQENFQQVSEAKKAESVAGAGFEGTKKGGTSGGVSNGSAQRITMSGSTAKDMVVKTQGMSFDMVSMAKSIPDVAASMITTVLTQMLNQGFNMATMKINQVANQITIPSIQSQIQSGRR